MIQYNHDRPWEFFCMVTGSTVPKACRWAVPAAIASVLVHYCYAYLGLWVAPEANLIDSSTITIFCSIFSFLLVFRTGQAYNRWWEGATLVVQTRGEWYQAVSSLFAFCSRDEKKHEAVEEFQDLIVRLVSLMYAAALQRISAMDDGQFEVIDPFGIDEDSLDVLSGEKHKTEIIMQWVQEVIVRSMDSQVLDIPPPISSRVFQELSIGMVRVQEAEKVSTLPMPMPYAQMIWLMLVIFSSVCPIVCAVTTDLYRCWLYTFLCTLVYWCVHFIAVEIEMPFGDDANDLPVRLFQEEMNTRLEALLGLRAHDKVRLSTGRRSARFSTRIGGGALEIDKTPTMMMQSFSSERRLQRANSGGGSPSVRNTFAQAIGSRRGSRSEKAAAMREFENMSDVSPRFRSEGGESPIPDSELGISRRYRGHEDSAVEIENNVEEAGQDPFVLERQLTELGACLEEHIGTIVTGAVRSKVISNAKEMIAARPKPPAARKASKERWRHPSRPVFHPGDRANGSSACPRPPGEARAAGAPAEEPGERARGDPTPGPDVIIDD